MGVFAALKAMVTSCDPAGVRNASSGYRTACAVPLLWWALPDGLRRAAFVVENHSRGQSTWTETIRGCLLKIHVRAVSYVPMAIVVGSVPMACGGIVLEI